MNSTTHTTTTTLHPVARATIIISLTLLAMLTLTSCLTTAETRTDIHQWIGQPEGALVSSWGTPDRALTVHDGSRILTWEAQWYLVGIFVEERPRTCRKNATINPAGTITQFTTTGCQSNRR